jgi:hypothetical protein
MAKVKKSAKSKKTSVRVRDLKTSKNPKGGAGYIKLGPQQSLKY